MDVVWASESAARRLGGRVLDVAWAGGSAAKRFGGRIVDVAWANGSAARRFGGRAWTGTEATKVLDGWRRPETSMLGP